MKRFYTLLILCLGVFSTLMAHDAVVNGIYYNLDTTNKTAEVTYMGDSPSDEEYSGSVNIPASITYNGVSYKVLSIGDHAFFGCVYMTSIKIAEGIQEIGDNVFQGCASLTSIEFPNSVTTIGSSVFANYLSISGNSYPDVILRYITFGSGLTKVGTDAFGCAISSSLDEGAEVHYKGTADSWAKINFANKYANPLHDATDLYINEELLTEANITSATSISAYAFINCTSLTSVKMGSSVQKIGIEAFKGCNNLKRVTCYATTVPTVRENSFSNYNAYLYVPCAYKEDYDLHNVFGSFKYVKCVTDEEGDNNGGNSGTTPTPTPDPEPEPDPTVPAFVVAGNGGSDVTDIWCNGIEWDGTAEANRMKDADKDGIFEITYSNVPAGTWSFKVVVNTAPLQWLGGDFLDKVNSSAGYTIQNGGNIGFSLSNAADVTIKIDSADGKITLTTPSGNFGKVKIDYFSVANSDECLVENRFTAANNNTLKYTENIQFLEGNKYGYAGYRILGNCNYAVYEKNLRVEVTEAGIYDITIVFNGDYENPDFTITAVKQAGTTDPDTPDDPDTPVGPTPDPVNPGTPDDDTNVSVEEVSAIMIYAKEGTIYSEVDFEIYDLAGVNVTKLNGFLQGVYVVKTAEGNRLISVW